MVKNAFFIALSTLFVSLTLPTFLLAAEFSASVSRTQVNVNEGFSLTLTLKGTAAKESPVISQLNEHFTIYSEQRSTHTSILNGKVSSSISWQLALMPKAEGIVEIPSITIDTEEGMLSTKPITLEVVKDSALSSSLESRPQLFCKLSNPSPYKNEPFIYTASLISNKPLYNIQAEKMQLSDAMVELVEEPKLEERVIEGVVCQVVEFNYLITPLKAGLLKIPALQVQGAVPQKGENRDPFSAFFNANFHPLMAQGFDRLKPFTLMSEAMELTIEPIVADITPWLPAKAFSLQEQGSQDQTFRVGEPFSRTFLMRAEGLKASQLPSLEDLQGKSVTLKVYSDKPEESEKIHQGTLHSLRKETYTFIPQQAGRCVLPEIAITWWDSKNKEKRVATIPERTLEILPALERAQEANPTLTQDLDSIETTASPLQVPSSSTSPSLLLYALLGTLCLILMGALLWIFNLQKKIASLTQDPSQKPTKQETVKPSKPVKAPDVPVKKEKKEKLDDLNPT